MTTDADICLIVEGGYPYMRGGVASWIDALMRASPRLTFHVIAITISSQPRRMMFAPPPNLLGVTDVLLDKCPQGRRPTWRNAQEVNRALDLVNDALIAGDARSFSELIELIGSNEFGQAALLDSKQAWQAMERAYQAMQPNGPLLDFFWSWRFLVRSLLAVVSTPLPQAGVFHAVATGFAGLVGGYARVTASKPLIVTEHGIYTNERRIELAVADWLFDSGAGGYEITSAPGELRSMWLNAFRSFSCMTYAAADVITTQYRANQTLQRTDGAPDEKLRIIPNGIDIAKFPAVPRKKEPRAPTVLMVGRVVPIKDVRTFVAAIALLKDIIPDVTAFLVGPEDEDPEYAAGCRSLVHQLGAESAITLLGAVPDVLPYLQTADVLVMTSISEAQPIAVLEAAAIGLPIVSTDVGSCREIIEGFDGDPTAGRGGIVVDPCTPSAVAEALAKILGDADMRAQMADVMRRRVAAYYNKERVTRLYEALYSDLMSQSIAAIGPAGHVEHQQYH